MEPGRFLSHRLNNLIHALLLLGGMGGLLVAIGWILAGGEGILWALALGTVAMVVTPRVSPRLVLSMYRARPLTARESPELVQLLHRLAASAGLPEPPSLFYVPSPMLNAFSLGMNPGAAVAVTDGLLRNLGVREITAVLAHEVSHIRHNDMGIMALADSVSRLVRLFSWVGQILVLINLPIMITQGRPMPWIPILLLVFAPGLSGLLQMALSRNREFDADLEAVRLTGDPHGLAGALERLDAHQERFWRQLMWPYRGSRQPSLLRTHPATEERIARLRALSGQGKPPAQGPQGMVPPEAGEHFACPWSPPTNRPRSRWSGLWY